MSDNSALIDLDVPSTRRPQQSLNFAGCWRRLVGTKISVVTALGLMLAGSVAGGALTSYAAQSTSDIRLVPVSADISPDASPHVSFTDGQVHLDGSLTITNVGASPISVVGLQMDRSQARINGANLDHTIDPGVSSIVSVTVTLTCAKGPYQSLDGKASLIVRASADVQQSSPIVFDSSLWGERMLQECLLKK